MSHEPPAFARIGILAAGVVVLQALLVMWFAWPAERTAPRDLPVVVAGPAPQAQALADRLRAERPGAFRISTAPDATAADAALRDRAAYAAVIIGPNGPTVHVASAAGPTVALLFTQAAQELGGGRPVPVVDVVPAPADDPRGAGFAAGFLPLLLTSLAFGVAAFLLARTLATRLVGLAAFAVLAGLVTTAVLHLLGILTGAYLTEAAAVALLALAISAAIVGLGAALGHPGVALGVLVIFIVGNPISGLATAPELLPEPWGAVGQALPPGAGASLLRSVAFFDGARAAGPLWVLGAWAVAGLVLLAFGLVRRRPAAEAAAHSRPALDGANVPA